MEVTVRQLEPDRFIYNLKAEKDEMFDIGWVADYPHPQDFLDILFRSGAENNFAEYSNPELDALLDEAAVAADEAESWRSISRRSRCSSMTPPACRYGSARTTTRQAGR